MSYSFKTIVYSSKPNDNSTNSRTVAHYSGVPKSSSVLTEIKRLSINAKKQKDPSHVDEEEILLENTEKNRLLFKEENEGKDKGKKFGKIVKK